MRIAVGLNNEYSVPLPDNLVHAPLRVGWDIANELARQKHDVTIFCSKNSSSHLLQVTTDIPALGEVLPDEKKAQYDPRFIAQLVELFEANLYLKFLNNNTSFDIIHLNPTNILSSMPYVPFMKSPVIITLHMPSNPMINEIVELYLKDVKNVYFVSISDYQKKLYNEKRIIRTIYHGIPIQNFDFSESGGNHMIFIGRFKKEKGIEEAIETSLRTKRKLDIAGQIRASSVDYFHTNIEAQINNHPDFLHFVNFMNYSMTNAYYQTGKLFLFPLQWEEPFGLVLLEAMATGTPVIAFARGSIPEIIKDGETGFIVNPSDDDIRGKFLTKKTGIEGLCEAVERIYAMTKDQYRSMRKACREQVETSYTVRNMVDQYVELYKEIISYR